MQPVVRTRDEETQGGGPRQQRQRLAFLRLDAANGLVSLQQGLSLGHVEGMVALETPGIERDGNVIDQGVVAGEIKVDQAGELIAEKEDIVGKKIGVDHALGQVRRPMAGEVLELALDGGAQAWRYFIGVVLEAGIEIGRASCRERV